MKSRRKLELVASFPDVHPGSPFFHFVFFVVVPFPVISRQEVGSVDDKFVTQPGLMPCG